MRFVLWLVVCIILCLAALRYVERHSIYFPMRVLTYTPLEARLPYEDVSFSTSDNKRLHGWFIPAKGDSTLLFCHGNAGNIGHRLDKISIFHGLGLDIFIFDYRGYGKSEGTPSESGLYRDGAAAYDYLTKTRKVPPDRIILYGESIGAAVAIELAKDRPVKALITEEAFTSAKDMIEAAYPYLPHFVFSSRFDSVSKIRTIPSRKLIIHSVDDEIVPFSLGRKLFEAARPPKQFLELRGGHNTAFLDSAREFKEGIRLFLK